MRLKSLEYSEYEGEPSEWTLRGLTLQDLNLLVGKNASGKSRVLNVIHGLASAITGKRELYHGNFHLVFDNNGEENDYKLKMRDSKIVEESFSVNDDVRLKRGRGGEGALYAEKEDKNIDFQMPEDQLAVVARRDKLQHPFFEPLHVWAESLYHYAFGTTLGKDKFPIFIKAEGEKEEINTKDSSQVVPIFRKGKEDFEDTFTDAICEDMRRIGYLVTEIGLATPRSVKFKGPLPGEVSGIYVRESDLPAETDQHSMSQGMFRAVSIFIQVNYSVLAGSPSCILIDDIGEGLDFDRSCKLIDVLMEKAKNSSVQLLMATNDRFIMNRVPLDAWSVVDRKGNHVEIRNYENSKEIFDQFKFTGLNNFDFLAFDYLHAETADE